MCNSEGGVGYEQRGFKFVITGFIPVICIGAMRGSSQRMTKKSQLSSKFENRAPAFVFPGSGFGTI
jgi:hypothetical protein